MSFSSIEDCLDKVNNRYLLLIIAAKRSRQLNRGATPLIESRRKKVTSISLEEIAAGKVFYSLNSELNSEK